LVLGLCLTCSARWWICFLLKHWCWRSGAFWVVRAESALNLSHPSLIRYWLWLSSLPKQVSSQKNNIYRMGGCSFPQPECFERDDRYNIHVHIQCKMRLPFVIY
jgi:hypothetical protein